MNYERMTKAQLIKALKSLQSKVDTTKDSSLCNPEQTSSEAQIPFHKLQILQKKYELQSIEMLKLQHKLEEMRKRYVSIYDFSPVGYVTLDESGCIKDINLTCAELLGVERSRLVDISFNNFVDKNSAHAFLNHLQKSKYSKEKVTTEVAFRVKGELVWVQMLSVPQLNAELQYNLCGIAVVDITDYKSREETRGEAKEGYRKLIETTNDAVFIVDCETGIILDVNRYVERLIGMPADEIVDLHFTKLHPEEDVERYKKFFEKHYRVKEGRVDAEDLIVCHKDGSRINVEISTNVIEFEGGKKIIQGIFRDIAVCEQTKEMSYGQGTQSR